MSMKFFNRLFDHLANRLPLRWVLILLFILQIIAVSGLVGWLSFQNGQQAVNDVAKLFRFEIMDRIEQHLSSYIETPHLINGLNLNAIQLGQLELENVKSLEKHFFEQIQKFDSVSYLYFGQVSGDETGMQRKHDGNIITWHGDPAQRKFVGYATDQQGKRLDEVDSFDNYDAREQIWYQSALKKGKPAWTPVIAWLTTTIDTTSYSNDAEKFKDVMIGIDANMPIYDNVGKLQGVMGTTLMLTDISEFLSTLKIGQHGQTFIMERSGEIVANSSFEFLFISHQADSKDHKRRKATESNIPLTRATAEYLKQHFGDFKNIQTSEQLEFEMDGQRQFVQVAPFRDELGLDWLVVVAVPENDFMGQINANTRHTIMLSVVALIVAIFIALLTANWIIKPILQINTAAKKLSQGQWEQTLPLKRSDEVGQLARSFDFMAKQLQTSINTLEVKNQELQALDELKDEFLANTSHELRTPLNGIIGIAESLIEGIAGQLPERANANLAMIISSGRRLSILVNDILDFSKLKHKEIELELKPVGLHEMVDVVLTFSQALLGNNKSVELINAVEAELPLVQADENRLQQILHNLIGNAIKFTEEGKIEIAAKVINNQIEMSISDTGIGISVDKQDRIFESFEQVEGGAAREYGGTGLGLAVTKQLVELHGGELWVKSTLEKGSQFFFSLPISETPRSSQPPIRLSRPLSKIQSPITEETDTLISQLPEGQTTSNSEEFKILVVDDEAVNLQVVTNFLSLQNYRITPASSGKEAIEIIEKGFKPDAILLDVMMPRMTGYEVTKKLRDKWQLTELPILLLTAKNQVEDLVIGLEMGANDYLTKPFSKDELLARMKTHLNIKRLKEENIRMSAELEISRRLQQMLLPQKRELQEIEDLDIAGFMDPADEVGGDYYDVLYQNGRVLIGIGDVTGHGLESGALAIMVQSSIKTLLAAYEEMDSVKFLSALNQMVFDNVLRMKTHKTLTLALLSYQNRQLVLTGQHEEMLLIHANGELEKIDTMDLGFPIGLEMDITDWISETQMELNSGEVVVLYTDGITEAINCDEEEYGLERLCEVAKQNWQSSAKTIQEAVINDVYKFIGEQKVFDDITLLVLKQK